MAAAGPQPDAAADRLPEMATTEEGERATHSALQVHSDDVLPMSSTIQSCDTVM